MRLLTDVVLPLATSVVGSLVGVGVWIYYDLDGFFHDRKHRRVLRKGAKYEARRRYQFGLRESYGERGDMPPGGDDILPVDGFPLPAAGGVTHIDRYPESAAKP